MDETAKKSLLRTVPYGLYAATTRPDQGDPHVFLLSWFTQCSFDPPLVAIGVHKESRAYDHLTATPEAPLAINLLSADQKELAQGVMKKDTAWTDDTVAGASFETGKNGCALITDTLGALEAAVVEEAGADGDHAVLVCRITDARRYNEGEPLTHENTGWKYGG